MEKIELPLPVPPLIDRLCIELQSLEECSVRIEALRTRVESAIERHNVAISRINYAITGIDDSEEKEYRKKISLP